MDRVFSMIDIEGQFWLSPPSPSAPTNREDGLNRSSSEWEFRRFLEEATEATSSSDVKNLECAPQNDVVLDGKQTVAYPGGDAEVDSEGYQAFLKAKLDMACAAVAKTRVGCIKPLESANVTPHTLSELPNKRETGQAASALVHDVTKRQDKDAVGPIGLPSLPAVQKQPCVQVISTTSGSSGEQSDDDGEITESMDPADTKRTRRMLSNRESARRSRSRKQAQQSELETKVSQLRVEHSTLGTKLANVSQQYNEAAVDNRVLKADVETLRAKVKMAEERVKRITGLNSFMQFVPEISTAVPSSSSDTSSDITLPLQDDLMKQRCYAAPPNNHISRDIGMQNSLVDVSPIGNSRHPPTEAAVANNNIIGTASVQSCLEHFQKRNGKQVNHSGNQG